MTVRFHITKSGRTEPCTATVRACPLGEANHFDSMKDAATSAALHRMRSDSDYEGDGPAAHGRALVDMERQASSYSEEARRDLTAIETFRKNFGLNKRYDGLSVWDTPVQNRERLEQFVADYKESFDSAYWDSSVERLFHDEIEPSVQRLRSELVMADEEHATNLHERITTGTETVGNSEAAKAVRLEETTAGLRGFYFPEGRNYATGATGVFSSQNATDYLVTREQPRLNGAAEGWIVDLSRDAYSATSNLLSGLYDKQNPESLRAWRDSEWWDRAAPLFPETFSQIEKELEAADYDRDRF